MYKDHGSSGSGAKCKRVNSLSRKIWLTAVGMRQSQTHLNKIHKKDVKRTLRTIQMLCWDIAYLLHINWILWNAVTSPVTLLNGYSVKSMSYKSFSSFVIVLYC